MIERGLRRKITIALFVILFPIAYWPGGEFLEGAFSAQAYFLWVVLVIPGIHVLIFAVNAYMNVQDDVKLEEGQSDQATTTAGSGGGD